MDPNPEVEVNEKEAQAPETPVIGENSRGEQLLFTIREAAIILGCHKATVYRLVYQGNLRVCRAFGSLRIPRKEIERLVADVKVYGAHH